MTEIKIDSIDLPFRLKCFGHKQGIITLEELLNIKYNKILRSRNIGMGTIAKSRKIIIEHLNNMKDCFRRLGTEDKNIVVSYFPLLKGFFRTSRLNFNFIYQDLSCINVPKRILEYIKRKKEPKIIYDLLCLNYDELKKEQNIGHKTIGKLQCTLISLLNIERVVFLGKPKKYELVTIPKVNLPLPSNSVSASVNKFV
ncbi:MAG: hypothetical protein PHY57_10085 [Ignavibacterium sp.]|nr:hypothetical protein [Ignavibacterium sp.]